ncbi:uncharacterized protein LOC114521976 [Dendronephthya gigantea]|uniref:uncharacterized protein LOC114521976 n=1 Tax=Dendronephthya gigantea TaxID=151771 RepID=UPI00106AA5C3|nr:uncharacterized protein LOC114521976 [Dendronephthya gigantea]
MAFFNNILGRNYLKELSVLLYFVILLCCCHVSCVFVNVTRSQRDILSFPGILKDKLCASFCQKRKSFYDGYSKSQEICICKCRSDFRTFVAAKSECVADKNLRNAGKSPLKFLLYEEEGAYSPLYITQFDSNATEILFKVPALDDEDKKCILNDFEVLSMISHGNTLDWNSVKSDVNYTMKELDDSDIEKDYPWINDKHEGWIMLTLNWTINPNTFTGRIMRLNVTCEGQKKGNKKTTNVSGFMVFKVNGTLRVPDRSFKTSTMSMAPIMSTTHSLTPALSSKSILTTSSDTVVVVSTKFISMTSLSMESSSLVSMISSEFISVTSSLHVLMTSSSFQPLTSPSFIPKSSKFETTRFTSTMSSMMILNSSSPAVAGPMNASKSPNTAAVTGGVVAGVVLLLLGLALLVYTLRKRRMDIKRRTHSDLGQLDPYHPSLSSLPDAIPALNNPLNDGIYVNPEVIEDERDRRSGIMAVDSAAYDACIIVENPSANREATSMYDNVPEPPENMYKALDPTKREPSAKYESLIKPTGHEYSTVADISGDPVREPLYSEIDQLQPTVQIRNANGLTAPPLEPRKSEPIYNVLENSGEVATPGNSTNHVQPPPLAPRNPLTSREPMSRQKPLAPAVKEQSICNQLENREGKEESIEVDDENGPVYSVLEN